MTEPESAATPSSDTAEVAGESAPVSMDEALTELTALCQANEPDAGELIALVSKLATAGAADAAYRLLDEKFGDPEAGRAVATAWVQACRAAGRLEEVAARLEKMDWHTPAWHAAAQAYLDEVGTAGDSTRPLRNRLVLKFVKRHQALISKDTSTWAAAGRALLAVTGPADVLLVMGDWRHRAPLTPTMLRPVLLAAWQLGKLDEANEVSQQALQLPEDAASHLHRVHQAFFQLQAGEREQAGKLLDQVELAQLPPGDREFGKLTLTLAHLLGQDRSGIDREAAQKKLKEAFPAPHDEQQRRAWHLALSILAGHLGQNLRAWWYRRQSR